MGRLAFFYSGIFIYVRREEESAATTVGTFGLLASLLSFFLISDVCLIFLGSDVTFTATYIPTDWQSGLSSSLDIARVHFVDTIIPCNGRWSWIEEIITWFFLFWIRVFMWCGVSIMCILYLSSLRHHHHYSIPIVKISYLHHQMSDKWRKYLFVVRLSHLISSHFIKSNQITIEYQPPYRRSIHQPTSPHLTKALAHKSISRSR